MRYDVRQDSPLGTWCVWDRRRGRVASIDGAEARDLSQRDALKILGRLSAASTPGS